MGFLLGIPTLGIPWEFGILGVKNYLRDFYESLTRQAFQCGLTHLCDVDFDNRAKIVMYYVVMISD